MSINIVQAIILGLFASLSSMPGLGGVQYARTRRNFHR